MAVDAIETVGAARSQTWSSRRSAASSSLDAPAHEGFKWLLGSVLVCVAVALGLKASPARAFQDFSWQPIAIFVALEMFTGLVVQTGIFNRLAVLAATLGKGRGPRLLAAFASLLMVLGLANNNLTSLVVALPILLPALESTGPDGHTVRRTMASLLAVGNCAGAATPIGDFPAIMIMASGLIGFGAYLAMALPLFLLTAAVLTAFHCVLLARGAKRRTVNQADTALALLAMQAKHRHRTFDGVALAGLLCVFGAMVILWVLLPAAVVPPALTAWAGLAVAAVISKRRGLVPNSSTFDLDPVVRLAGIYFAASLLATTPLMSGITKWLGHLHSSPLALIVIVMSVTLVFSAIIDAGAAAAALLPVLASLCTGAGPLAAYRPVAVIGFAAAICAGSSLFLTSATAGHLMSSRVRSADLIDPHGVRISFGFSDYLVPGLLNAAIQSLIAVAGVALFLGIGS